MHASAPTPNTNAWHEKFVRSGYFFGALLLHLLVFSLVATLVVWRGAAPPPTADFQKIAIPPPQPPPIQPPSSGEAANNLQFEPQPVVVPVVTPPSVVTTINPSAINVDTSKVMDQALSHLSNQMAQGTGLSSGGGAADGAGNAFGSSAGTANQLTGFFYDLKQTADENPTNIDIAGYYALLLKYVSQGWDESLLGAYYKSKTPLYAESLAISARPSGEAPKAFNLEHKVQPGLWIVHYHGKVEASKGGEYRFAGFGDNVLIVKIDGKIVLDAGFAPLIKDQPDLHKPLPFAFPSYLPYASSGDPHLRVGPTFRMEAANAVDMDVLIGDDGGRCAFFLLIQNMSNIYDSTPDGTPELPYFQLNTKAGPTFLDGEELPPSSGTPEPWQAAPN